MKKIILGGLLGVLAFWAWQTQNQLNQLSKSPSSTHAMIQQDTILAKIRQLNQLQSSAFHVESIIKTEKQGNWFVLWQDSQKGLFVAKGQVQAGLNLDELHSQHIQILPDTVLIQLPPVRIQDVQLDNIEVFDIQTGLFNVYQPDMSVLQTVQTQAKQQILQQACQNGILQHAQQHSANQITQLFQIANMKNMKVSVYPSAQMGECKISINHQS